MKHKNITKDKLSMKALIQIIKKRFEIFHGLPLFCLFWMIKLLENINLCLVTATSSPLQTNWTKLKITTKF